MKKYQMLGFIRALITSLKQQIIFFLYSIETVTFHQFQTSKAFLSS